MALHGLSGSLVRAKGTLSFYEDGHQDCCRVRKVGEKEHQGLVLLAGRQAGRQAGML